MGEVIMPLAKGLFGIGNTPAAPVINSPPPMQITPTPVQPAPGRSDADIQAQAAAQRKKYASGGVTPTNLTGGLGVPTSSTYSASTNALGL